MLLSRVFALNHMVCRLPECEVLHIEDDGPTGMCRLPIMDAAGFADSVGASVCGNERPNHGGG
jgi:hypothetical protein